MLIIGDVHGKTNQFLDLVADYRKRSSDLIIQLGDLGFQKQWKELNQYCKETNETKLVIVPGNHDDYSSWDDPKLYFMVAQKNQIDFNKELFGLGGANSIDKHLRTEGIDWFPQEEMSYSSLGHAVDLYIEQKPKYMFSHTCPSSVKKQLFGYDESSRTEQALQVMFELHQPEYHFFGHFHRSVDEMINGTRFICLAELQTFEL